MNNPALYLENKASTLTRIPVAIQLWLPAVHQCHYCNHSMLSHIEGMDLVMVDDEPLQIHQSILRRGTIIETVHLVPRDDFSLICVLEGKQLQTEVVSSATTKVKAWLLLWLIKCKSGRLAPCKMLAQCTLLISLLSLPTKFLHENQSKLETLQTWEH